MMSDVAGRLAGLIRDVAGVELPVRYERTEGCGPSIAFKPSLSS